MIKSTSGTLEPLTHEILWNHFDEYRGTHTCKPLFLSLGQGTLMRVYFRLWTGPSMSDSDGQIAFPVSTDACQPDRLAIVSRDIDRQFTEGQASLDDVRGVLEVISPEKGWNRNYTDIGDLVRSGRMLGILSMRIVSFDMMPVGCSADDMVILDHETSARPLAVTGITNEVYSAPGETYIPSIPLPVFIDKR